MINLAFMLLLTVTLCSPSQYANIINQFVELNNELGNPREDVGVIIANVKNVISEQEKRDEGFFNSLSQNCASSEGGIKAALAKLGNDINDSTKSLNDWKASLTSSAAEISKAEADIKSTTAKLATARKAIDSALEEFKVIATETDQKLNVVKSLRDIITDELINNNGRPSFVQLTKFNDKLNELKAMLNSETDSLYTPLVSVLLTLASEQNFSDQAILKRILENINNLENNLKQFRQQRETGLNTDLKNLRSNVANLARIRAAYENMRAQSFSKRIDAQHYIHFYNHEIQHFNAEKTRRNDELALLGKICGFENASHQKDRKELQEFKTKVVPYIIEQIQRLSK